MSGLRLNSKKTEALWIGSMVGNKEKLFPEKNFKWPENKVKVLGVWLSIDPNITLNINYREKADKIKNILSNWKYRRLTLLGKIQVIKSLAASQLTYILAPLATNHKIIKEINNLFYSFLWDNKGDKIKRSVMINDYSSRGDGVTSAFSKLRPIWISHLHYFFSKNGKIKMTKKWPNEMATTGTYYHAAHWHHLTRQPLAPIYFSN